MGDEGKGNDGAEDSVGERPKRVGLICRLGQRLEQCRHNKRDACGAKQRYALEEIVVPGVAAVEDGKRLGDVEGEPVIRRKGPFSKIESVSEDGHAHDKRPA